MRQKLSFDVLDAILRGMVHYLLEGKLTLDEYVDDYDRALEFAGWTWDEFGLEVDSRWTSPMTQSAALC